MEIPDAWAARVMEALMRVRLKNNEILGTTAAPWDDSNLLIGILLEMRVGVRGKKFLSGNLNMFQRYSFDVFRCHVCNHVLLEGSTSESPTKSHNELHRTQVSAVLNPNFKLYPSWEYSREPTKEEVFQEDERIKQLEAKARDGFHQKVRAELRTDERVGTGGATSGPPQRQEKRAVHLPYGIFPAEGKGLK